MVGATAQWVTAERRRLVTRLRALLRRRDLSDEALWDELRGVLDELRRLPQARRGDANQ